VCVCVRFIAYNRYSSLIDAIMSSSDSSFHTYTPPKDGAIELVETDNVYNGYDMSSNMNHSCHVVQHGLHVRDKYVNERSDRTVSDSVRSDSNDEAFFANNRSVS